MRSVWLASLLLFVAVGCGHHVSRRLTITQIEVSPTPTAFVLRASTATPRGQSLLSSVASKLPKVLPANPSHQRCHTGTTIAFTIGARIQRYGPCIWPPAIERLRQALLRADGNILHVSPTAGAARWKAVLNDWYDGHFDQWHSCGAVLEALRHLPEDPMIYSTIEYDLKASVDRDRNTTVGTFALKHHFGVPRVLQLHD